MSYVPKEYLRKTYQKGVNLLKKSKDEHNISPFELQTLRTFNLEIEGRV